MFNFKSLEVRFQILQDRNQRLIKAWCESADEEYKKRCMRLSIRIEDKLRHLRRVYYKAKADEEAYQFRLDNELVHLSCNNFGCEYLVAMPRKEYKKEDVVICDTCGKEMLTEEEWEIKEMLFRHGIYT